MQRQHYPIPQRGVRKMVLSLIHTNGGWLKGPIALDPFDTPAPPIDTAGPTSPRFWAIDGVSYLIQPDL